MDFLKRIQLKVCPSGCFHLPQVNNHSCDIALLCVGHDLIKTAILPKISHGIA
jgi:hypothetical protein